MLNSEKSIRWLAAFQRRPFIQILRRTMEILFPVVLLGGFSWVLYANLLSADGFLGTTLRVTHWLPQWQFFRALFNDLTNVTIGWISPYAALVSALLTTRYYHKTVNFAGVAAIIAYVLIFIHTIRGSRQAFEMRYYNAAWFIIGVIVGYLVGRVFVRYGHESVSFHFGISNKQVIQGIITNLKPFFISTAGAFVLHLTYALIRAFNLDLMAGQRVSSAIERSSNYLLNITLSLVNTVLVWLGFAQPLTASNATYSSETSANLIYALSHKTAWHIPYPFTPSALYSGFALFGGVGVTLALVIALWWVDYRQDQQFIAKASFIPGFFNVGLPILFGKTVFWNPVLVVPFVGLPIFNMLIASVLIFFHVMPPLVYPVPYGTPGVLRPFVATGGNWVALVVTLLLLLVDVLLYVPFIKLAIRVDKQNGGHHNG